jgi:uncharacterized protein YbjT (DUF2867 family)
MPVVVVGADTELGEAIVAALLPEAAEIRAFVSDVGAAEAMKARGVKVAVGDVSDGIRVGDAAHRAFCVIFLAEAATDDRERSFTEGAEETVTAWADGLAEAGVTRVIWVGGENLDPTPFRSVVPQVAEIAIDGQPLDVIVAEVVAAEDAEHISGS